MLRHCRIESILDDNRIVSTTISIGAILTIPIYQDDASDSQVGSMRKTSSIQSLAYSVKIVLVWSFLARSLLTS